MSLEVVAPTKRASDVNVKELRLSLSMSQPEFAAKFGLSIHTLRQWERRRKHPDGAAQTLLQVIKHNPEIVMQAIRAA